MPNIASNSIHPDAVESLPADFRIDGVLGVRAVLRDLVSRKVLVSLYPDDRTDQFLVTRITHLDDDEVEFDLSGPGAAVDAISGARSVTGVAFPGRIKTQFRLTELRMTGFSLRAAERGEPLSLTAPIPDELWRIQRRDAFRVVPPFDDGACCVRRTGPDAETSYPVSDLSAGGAALVLPPGEPTPAVGERWPHSRIETTSGRLIPCDLIVRHVVEDPDGSGAHRVGCAFQALPGDVQRQLQLYVIDIDKRMRRSA
jgi:c-di-GMP-binding flagellar brake protein YcgR